MHQESLFDGRPKPSYKPKNCSSGRKFQNQVKTLLLESGWHVDLEYVLGHRLGKKSKHRVDIKATKDRLDILISCKYQDVPGTAPDKLPYEYMCMLHAVEANLMDKGFLVLFGEPLLKENVFHPMRIEQMARYMTISNKVQVCSFEEFYRIINRHEFQ